MSGQDNEQARERRSDQQRWDARYAAGAYADRTHPSAYLAEIWQKVCATLPMEARACDVACGAGRNAIYLSQQGCSVDGLDVSGVALSRAEDRARELGLTIGWHRCDLLREDVRLPRASYDLIVMVRFVAASIIPTLAKALAPGGYLLIEEHLQWHDDIELSGPKSARFRVAPGALEDAFAVLDAPLSVVERFEGLIDEVDGSRAAVARILVCRESDGIADGVE